MEMNPVQIINQPHPLIPSAAREVKAQNWKSGETARMALLRAGIDPNTEIVILVNDRTLTVAEWDTVCPQPGDLVHAVAAVSGGGGDGGSNPMKAIMSIAVMIVAWYAAPMVMGYAAGSAGYAAAAAGGSMLGVGIASAAISIAGNMILSSVFKSSPSSLSSVNSRSSNDAAASVYSLSGGSNSVRQYGPMQVVMGTHRVFPDYGAKPYTEFQGDDQYLYQIFNFGVSSLQISDLRIGDSALSNYSSVALYWSDSSGGLPQFPGNVDSSTGGVLTRGADWITRTSAADTVRLAVDVEGSIYYAGDSGLVPCSVGIEAQYRPEGGANWLPLMYGTVVTYTTGFWSLQTTEQVYVYPGSTPGHTTDGYNSGASDGDSGDSSSSSGSDGGGGD